MDEFRVTHEFSSLTTVSLDSRYVKAVRCLLEEVIDIGGKEVELCNDVLIQQLFPGRRRRRSGFGLSSEIKSELCNSGFMSLPENHELHIKITKLLNLLQQVEERFDMYCNQLEQAISSFEEIAGEGSSKLYTGLALQAMTRHFGSLQEAILSQLNSLRRRFIISHQDVVPSSGLSQLNLFDGNSPSSLQRLGLVQGPQRHAWKPIRGLPETSVAILRAWLFHHFLHPYPSDEEKLMLASQTCLSKNQVSNWFINARVRLWKPMIEEMYREEFGDSSDESMQRESNDDSN